ncbi:MAG: hypothetical protein CME66_09175 [Halobacteriovoraceae bacterium]|nr:hypothetical protein [Halobacteriovoraceae bacterium]
MKKLLLSTALLLGTFSVFADANMKMEDTLYEKDTYESKSHYQTLGELFQSGSVPNIEKLTGVAWAGRCFPKNEPNTPTNAGYIFRVAKKDDVGPIGRGKSTYEVGSYWKRGEAPNYLDTMTIENVYEEIKPKFKKVKSYEGGIVIDLNKTDISVLRLSGEYLIEEIGSRKGEDVGPIGGNTSYETGLRCYYFIPEYARN